MQTSFGHPLFASFIAIFLKAQAPVQLRYTGWSELLHSKLVVPVASCKVWEDFDLAPIQNEQDPQMLRTYASIIELLPPELALYTTLRQHPQLGASLPD